MPGSEYRSPQQRLPPPPATSGLAADGGGGRGAGAGARAQPAGLTRYHTHEISHCGNFRSSAPLLLPCSPSPSRPSDVPPSGRPRRTPSGGAGGHRSPQRALETTPPSPPPEEAGGRRGEEGGGGRRRGEEGGGGGGGGRRRGRRGEEGGGSGGAAETLLHVNRRTGRLEGRFPLIFISRKPAVARPSCGPWKPLRGARIEIRK